MSAQRPTLNDREAFLDRHSRLEAAKYNVQRCYHVVEQARMFLLESQSLSQAPGGEFDMLESILCAAVTMLSQVHAVMVDGDECALILPCVL